MTIHANTTLASKVAELVAVFPTRELSEATVVAYAARLSRFPAELIELAIDRLIETNRFFPPISEILDAAGLGGNDLPPFVVDGPIGHPATVSLWAARLRHGQQLRFDRQHCPPVAPSDPVNRLIWLRSINRSVFAEYGQDLGLVRWNRELADAEDAVGVPLVPAVGRGGV